ncbi:MAG: hypothetical protein WD872_13365 [Pirellulaceae bacterium]
MPIKVQCTCGAAFAAKDELALRTVKCPKCQQPLKIPAAGGPAKSGAAAPRPATPAAPAQQRPAARQLAAPLPSAAPSMYDEAGLVAHQVGTAPCPGCVAPMPLQAVVCIHCGYNKKIGRRMETMKVGAAAPLPGGHSVSVDELLEKAAVNIQEEKDSERKKTSEGMPWWAYLIGMVCVVGFMVTMMVLPQRTALMYGGGMMWALTALLGFYAYVRLAMFAFSEGVGQGVMFLICGPYQLYFVFTHWGECGGYVLMWFGANVVNGLVQGVMMYTLTQEEEEAHRLDPAPAAVAQAGFDWRPAQLRKGDS